MPTHRVALHCRPELRHAAFLTLVLGLGGTVFANDCEIIFNREHCPDADTILYPLAVRGVLAESVDALTPWVRVDLAADPWFAVDLRPVSFIADRSTAFNFAVVGVQGGNPNQTLATAYLLQEVEPAPLTAFGSILSPGGFRLLVEVYDGPRLVGSELVNEPRWGVQTDAEALLTGFTYDPREANAWIEMRFETAVPWTIDTVQATGDRLRFTDPDGAGGVDALEWASVEGIFIREFVIDDEAPGCPGPTLTVNGTCPGELIVRAACLEPGGRGWLIAAGGPGSATIPFGPCAGVTLGLDRTARLIATAGVDADGSATFDSRFVPAPLCDRALLQVVDAVTCATSDVTPLR